MAAHLTRRLTSKTLQAAASAADWSEWMAWKLDDGAEVLRVDRLLLVALPDGRVLRRSCIPTTVPVSALVAQMRRGKE